jgi:hypothetical protein
VKYPEIRDYTTGVAFAPACIDRTLEDVTIEPYEKAKEKPTPAGMGFSS